jgi:hypothetical protein
MVYVDRIQKGIKYDKFKYPKFYLFCHLTADNFDELLEFATKLGLKKLWLQESRNGTKHFDITLNKRKLALKLGAVEK